MSLCIRLNVCVLYYTFLVYLAWKLIQKLPEDSRLCPGKEGWASILASETLITWTQYKFPIVAVHLIFIKPRLKWWGSVTKLNPSTEFSKPSAWVMGEYSTTSEFSGWENYKLSSPYTCDCPIIQFWSLGLKICQFYFLPYKVRYNTYVLFLCMYNNCSFKNDNLSYKLRHVPKSTQIGTFANKSRFMIFCIRLLRGLNP